MKHRCACGQMWLTRVEFELGRGARVHTHVTLNFEHGRLARLFGEGFENTDACGDFPWRHDRS